MVPSVITVGFRRSGISPLYNENFVQAKCCQYFIMTSWPGNVFFGRSKSEVAIATSAVGGST